MESEYPKQLVILIIFPMQIFPAFPFGKVSKVVKISGNFVCVALFVFSCACARERERQLADSASRDPPVSSDFPTTGIYCHSQLLI